MMKGIKVILYIYAVIYLLGLVLAFLPISTGSDLLNTAGSDLPGAMDPFTLLWTRMSGVGFGLAGIFFLILARNPFGYGVMLPFAGYGQICVGLFYSPLNIWYGSPLASWLISAESILLVGTGALLLILAKKTSQAL
uniref:DUF4345 domain-containing protein n=1 Tax=Candidatus Kentrum sp. LFY TaxID=2126342 RepID=A0A450U5D3_9GAMM|nr:MAG: hypothetical protein BECKLFY1418B_GA0070995_10039 [Candidatus Kentron sp. LFY]VFJ92077.1 MAG: hypothetical protein BECKLFY1418A_GA0070994_102031 [Candidatus Kentron sp. LFY]VFK18045.1 MAG: hypothetical protein BECKLFY1418C_GA0070996_103815 [Candidatus Kentron sp. LFY]